MHVDRNFDSSASKLSFEQVFSLQNWFIISREIYIIYIFSDHSTRIGLDSGNDNSDWLH